MIVEGRDEYLTHLNKLIEESPDSCERIIDQYAETMMGVAATTTSAMDSAYREGDLEALEQLELSYKEKVKMVLKSFVADFPLKSMDFWKRLDLDIRLRINGEEKTIQDTILERDH